MSVATSMEENDHASGSTPKYPIHSLVFMPPTPRTSIHVWPTIPYVHDGPDGKPVRRRVAVSKPLCPPTMPANQPTLVFCGGNAMSLDSGNADVADLIQRRTGIETYAWDYPGYGSSTGPPSPDLCVGGLLTLVQALKDKGHSFIALWGHSLGTGVAVKAASLTEDVKALVLTAPFSHTLGVTPWARFGALPAGWSDPFPSKAILEAISTPVSIIHGDEDAIIPFTEGQILFEAASTDLKSFLRMPHYGHNDLFSSSFPFAKVNDFLAEAQAAEAQAREAAPSSLASGMPKAPTET